MYNYKNGNADISISQDGTRTITFEDSLKLDYPLNIDIKVSSQCSFGYNPKTNQAFCTFCHESATTDGAECDYVTLKRKLYGLPEGIELAIGANNLTDSLCNFIEWCKLNRYIVNLTINQGHLKRDEKHLNYLIENDLIKGLGISYRSSLKFNVPNFVLNYPHTVFHVIMGIDTIDDVLSLSERNVKKVLVLGEKDFGFNKSKVDLTSRTHKEWYWWITKMFGVFDVVSFDNLALLQLNLRRLFNDKNWETFNQGEHSFYIDAVEQVFKPSSRSDEKISWDKMSIKDYFKSLEEKYETIN
jgi:hypothetical protein